MELPLDSIICGDALTELKKLPSASVDLIITSPPYNIKNIKGNAVDKNQKKHFKGHKGKLFTHGYDVCTDNMSDADYDQWQHDILIECLRVIKDNGAIFYNHKFRICNKRLKDHSHILYGLPVRQIIIWDKQGGLSFNNAFFLPNYEIIYMIAKDGFKLKPYACNVGDIWRFRPEFKNSHPAPFPIGIPNRIIESTDSNIILDPFMGSGTTAAAAKMLGRHYIGFDISPKYCQMAKERLLKITAPIKTNWFYDDVIYSSD